MNLFQKTLAREPQNVPPIWFMRQAGRYHAHYQALRAKHTFDQLCRTPELACEVALGPVQDFDFDAAILFSDILYPLDALGLGLSFSDKGPAFQKRLIGETWNQLCTVKEAWPKLHFQGEAVRLTRARLAREKGLIGFVGAPWTLWTFAIEETHKGPLLESKKHLANWSRFRELIVPLLEQCIEDQLKNGADMVCLFDSSAGELTPELLDTLVRPDLERFAKKFPKKVLYYSKGTQPAHLRHDFWRSGALLGLGVDHRWDLKEEIARQVPQVLQGNFDQTYLHLDPPEFEKVLRQYLRPLSEIAPAERRGWILGLGHGVLPKTPEKNVRNFVAIAREVFR